jgi:hypothetical protein
MSLSLVNKEKKCIENEGKQHSTKPSFLRKDASDNEILFFSHSKNGEKQV